MCYMHSGVSMGASHLIPFSVDVARKQSHAELLLCPTRKVKAGKVRGRLGEVGGGAKQLANHMPSQFSRYEHP